MKVKTQHNGVIYSIDEYLDIVKASSFTVHYESATCTEMRKYPASQFLKAYTHYLRLEQRSINDSLRNVHSLVRFFFIDTKTSHQSTICQYVSLSNIGL